MCDPELGALHTFFRGPKAARLEIETIFSRVILGSELDPWKDDRVYDLNAFKRRGVKFVYDPASAIQDVRVKLLRLSLPDGASVQAGESLTGIRELWPHMTGEERRDLVRLVLVKVEIDLRTGSVGGLIPKPAFAPLFRVLAEEEDGLISVCGWRPRGGSGSSGTK
ncbi:MAG: hypothetical protein A2W26_01880 [Acidobacteria bacterium RBG_16_64_8]|nr:MAG: hypothetical protein A2W26_01880 [Acidobacteria bacterium RBG_16_64_8]